MELKRHVPSKRRFELMVRFFFGCRVLDGRGMCILYVRRIRSISSGRDREGCRGLGSGEGKEGDGGGFALVLSRG